MKSFNLSVIVEQKNGVLEISADIKPSPRESYLIKELKQSKNSGLCSDTKFCPKCTLGLDIKHTDVLILSQYLRSDGTMMPRRITGLCATQQRNIGTMVLMARHSGMHQTTGVFYMAFLLANFPLFFLAFPTIALIILLKLHISFTDHANQIAT